MKTDDLVWLQKWFTDHSNDDWEHCYGITIETLDNPGWRVIIDLAETQLATKVFTDVREEKTDADWLICRVRDGKFEGFGDPMKLVRILSIFRTWAESQNMGSGRALQQNR